MLSVLLLESFVSFSQKKAYGDSPDAFQEVVKLVSVMKWEGCNPWIHNEHLIDGLDLFQSKCSVLNSCESVIVVITSGYVQSLLNLREFYYAVLFNTRIKVFPIELETEGLDCDLAGNWLLKRVKKMTSRTFKGGQYYNLVKVLKSDEGTYGLHQSTIKFPYLESVTSNEQERSSLEIKLENETRTVMDQFQGLLYAFFFALINNPSFPAEILASCVNTTLENDVLPLKSVTYGEVFAAIESNSSFYNYRLVIVLAEATLGMNSNLKDQLTCYEKYFTEYADKRLYECPTFLGRASKSRDVEFSLKVELSLYKNSLKDLTNFKRKVCEILKKKDHLVRVLKVEEGCVKLVCVVSRNIQKEIFPLSRDQERALAKQGVLQLDCGDYRFEEVLMLCLCIYTAKTKGLV